MINKIKKRIQDKLLFLHSQKKLWLKIKCLKQELSKVEEEYQTANEQIDELLSKESQRESRFEAIADTYENILEEKDDYLRKV